jgi:hypothetical protein
MRNIKVGDYLIVLASDRLKGKLVEAMLVDYSCMYPIFVRSTSAYLHNSYLHTEVRLASKKDDPEYFI